MRSGRQGGRAAQAMSKQRAIAAYHEAGHAVLAKSRARKSAVCLLTGIARNPDQEPWPRRTSDPDHSGWPLRPEATCTGLALAQPQSYGLQQRL